MRVEGQRVLVTGAASGLGRATAEAFAQRGAEVVGVDLPAAIERAGAHVGVRPVAADVRDAGQLLRAVAAATAGGELRACVNCAGVGRPERVLDDDRPMALEAFARTLDVNLIGTFNVLRLAAAAMQRNDPVDGERGVIVNAGSVAATDAPVGQAAYAASKGAIAALTLPVARELGGALIRCVTIAPGLFDTPILGAVTGAVRQAFADAVPHPRRLGQPDEFAALAVHVAENPMLNGAVIRLDGALRMAPR